MKSMSSAITTTKTYKMYVLYNKNTNAPRDNVEKGHPYRYSLYYIQINNFVSLFFLILPFDEIVLFTWNFLLQTSLFIYFSFTLFNADFDFYLHICEFIIKRIYKHDVFVWKSLSLLQHIIMRVLTKLLR